MDVDAEFGEFEQTLLQLVRGTVEVEREVRKRVQDVQFGLGDAPGLGAVLVIERGDLDEDRLPFGLEIVVALPKPLDERVVGVGVFGLTEQVLLSTGQIRRSALQTCALLAPFRMSTLPGTVHVP